MIANPVKTLIRNISLAKTEKDLRLVFMDGAGAIFHSHHWSISLRDGAGNLAQVDLKGLPDSFLDYYIQYGMEIDPLRAYVLAHHAPVHEQVLFTEARWKRSDLYLHGCGKQFDHEHAMTGAIVGSGQIIGLVNFARTRGTPAFDRQDLADLSAICAHLSVSLAMLRSQPKPFISDVFTKLTPREQQIAELVAQGLTNAEIGAQLWITQNTVKQSLKRIFCKLNVSARTELVAKLFR
ncbi:LuxR C-terminal-related transcriptional regulator [Tumidithrix elongata RA019]|uniref:LuxR C-terminal-related transcriptional regulator n=1 Tax=Tumidithrix elongata BACA0141 TaxID=2716417 RepID=A0AAW9PTP0_9CYAN|nr:LuxR C-terminal-related transcriptional regulator [Tumidithrix elongata RA019]